MKLLVLATDYPRLDGYVSQYFIHTRNKEYVNSGLDITVLSFTAEFNYYIDGVNVITYKNLISKLDTTKFDILISHAPNLRNHYLFLNKYGRNFKKFIFFFHGHEVLVSSKVYPKQYSYTKNASVLFNIFIEIYDFLKLKLWKTFFTKHASKSEFIFVSQWMYDMFIRFVNINPLILEKKTHIIYNSIGKNFETAKYEKKLDKAYDFITIRNLLDKSKYCIDVIHRLAVKNPEYKFCVIGKGEFFNYNNKPNNLEFLEQHLTHDEVIEYLNKSKFALMPTRADAQGVMACEIASFGIPLITSDISVCREVFEDFENVIYIDNDSNVDFNSFNLKQYEKKEFIINNKFFAEKTIGKEIELFKKIVGE